MARMYIAPIDVTAATAARDVFEILAAAGKPIELHEIFLTTSVETDATEEQIQLHLFRNSGGTTGSGGTVVTGQAVRPNDGADAATVETGNTTQLTAGTDQTLAKPYMNNRVGWHYLATPESRIVIDENDFLVLAQDAAITNSAAYGGYIVYAELV